MQEMANNRRVLLVEDEYFLADDLAQALRKAGAKVVGPVPTLMEAIRILDSGEAIDFAVLDINLRGDSVFPFADELRNRGVPFIFATGYDQGAIPGTFSDVIRLEKPLDPEQVTKLVAEYRSLQ